jgi:DNA mismatch repair protein MutS2
VRRDELENLEFHTALDLIRGFARTRRGAEALGAMTPEDGRAGLRRLHQMELVDAWAARPQSLPIQPMDEALAELLHPGGWLGPEEWRQLREGLGKLATLLQTVTALTWPEDRPAPEGTHLGLDRLQVTAAVLADPAPLAEQLRRSFTEDGQLDPLRVPGLAGLHHARSAAFQAVQGKLQKLLRQVPDAFMESSIVERNGRFCLPVRSEKRGQVPGLVLDRSGTGATVFLEPHEAVGLNNDYVEADAEYREAVQAFLRHLLEELRARRTDFVAWADFQAQVDEALALLQWKALVAGGLPEIRPRLCLVDARHPLLLPQVRERMGLEPLDHPVVPLNLVLEPERPGLIISGSNTGGKTVVLKTVGLLSALAACGAAIPAAEGSSLPPLTSLHADIGDHQTLVGSLSTFSSHIVHLKEILADAKEGGLVLLDELGTGTDPKEGAALGIAVLHALSRRGCMVLCSTHLGEISQWGLRHQRFQNASVQFDEERLQPTYRLLVGLPGQSRALTIAEKLGLPKPVLEKAHATLGRREQDWRDFLRQLEADRLAVIEQAEELARREARIGKDQEQLRLREEKLREDQDKFAREAKEKLDRALDFVDHESKRLVKELKAKSKAAPTEADRAGTESQARVKQIRQIAEAELASLLKPKAAPVKLDEVRLGGYARHRGLGLEGKVVSLKGDRVTLETGQGRRFECRLGELAPITRKEVDSPRMGRVKVSADAEDVESQLTLIGRASDDIDAEVYRFVESSLAAGKKFIRIVHGHGTGRLKAAVREALRGHPGISKVEDAPQHQGGAGATLVTLR